MNEKRFEKTFRDLEDCYFHHYDGSPLSESEQKAKQRLVDLCKRVAESEADETEPAPAATGFDREETITTAKSERWVVLCTVADGKHYSRLYRVDDGAELIASQYDHATHKTLKGAQAWAKKIMNKQYKCV